jgi:hypothetical protein
VETNEVTFPIEVTRARGCEAGSEPAKLDPEGMPCGFAGQDAYFDKFTCVPTGG